MQLHPMSDDIEIRFRHTSGSDVGPLKIAGSCSVLAVKETVLVQWPKDGPMSAEPPRNATDLKLILGGKFLDNGELLNDLRPSMGEIKGDTIVTMHVIVRPAAAGKLQATSKEKERQQGCVCCIQ